jgi:hypothetical protein
MDLSRRPLITKIIYKARYDLANYKAQNLRKLIDGDDEQMVFTALH